MITFSRKKAAAQLSLTPSLATSDKENTADRGAEQSLPHFCKPKVHPCREKCSNDSADMPHTGKSKPTETSCLSLGPDLHEGMQQPSAPVVKTRLRGNTAPSQKLPSAQKHAKGRSLPPAPTTATRKVPEKCQQGPAINATPLTHPDLLSNSTEPEMSSGSNANGMLVSSDDDASSYEPSSREQASPDIAERGLPVARPPLHPKTFSKHGHNVPQRQTSTARASDDPAKPGSHRKSIVEPIPQLQGNKQAHDIDGTQDSLPKAAKQQRFTKIVLQRADLHVSKAAVHSMTAADSLLVEMPPGFDVAGDTGSIGRFNARSDGTTNSVEMGIKGTMYSAVAASCASSLLIVKVANTGDGAAGTATVELATNEFTQAIQLESGADLAARREWNDEDDDVHVAAADQGPKAKAPKAKARRKPQTKTASKKK